MEMLGWMQEGKMVALGWTLLHFCWQGAAIALLYALLDRVTVHAGARFRYGIAMVAITLMPLAAFITFVEQQRLVVHPTGNRPAVVSHVGFMHTAFVQDLPVAAPLTETSEVWIASHAGRLLPWVDTLWLAGVLLLTIRAVGGWWQLERLRHRARGLVPAEVSASFQRVAHRLRIGRNVALRISDDVISPLAMGVWRSAVILPASAILLLPTEQLEAVLAHELAHIRRWDYLCNLLQTTTECLLFFHPAVWWVSRCTRDLREVCCDEVAARSCADPVIYAEALLQLEEQRTTKLQLAMALKGHSGSLLSRVSRVLGEGITMERSMSNSIGTSGIRAAAVGAVILALVLGSRTASGLKPTQQKPAVASKLQRPHPQPEIEAFAAPFPALAAPDPEPEPSPRTKAAAMPAPDPSPSPAAMEASHDQSDEIKTSGSDYIRKMSEAGYPMDLNKDLDRIVSLRAVGVTPEYAKAMAQVGLGTPTLQELTNLKAVGVSPEYIAGLRSSGIPPSSFREAISEKTIGVTPEYAKSIAAIGMGSPSVHDLVGLKAQGVTPEYAKGMAQVGLGTPTLQELTSMKATGVSPEYVAALRSSGIPPSSFREAISEKTIGVTPEYAKSMASIGIGSPTVHDLIGLRAQGVTPEYASELKASGIPVDDIHQLGGMKAVGVTPEFAKGMATAGFTGLNSHDLLSLRAQGVTPEYARWLKQTYPTADVHSLRQGANFHVDADFIARAKSHGFNDTNFDKLVKLKMSGLLD
jgi:beta-lactamase regulating signal transducer with metallopeptidase domain